MKIAEIKNIETKELVEKLEAAVDALNKKKINHNVTPLENPSEIKVARHVHGTSLSSGQTYHK